MESTRRTIICIMLCIIIGGIVLFVVGCFYKVPEKALTTIPWERGKTLIEEYVGGDAYNYIIGAALVGGEIAGAKTAKAVYISVGMLLAAIGSFGITLNMRNKKTATNGENSDINGQNHEIGA